MMVDRESTKRAEVVRNKIWRKLSAASGKNDIRKSKNEEREWNGKGERGGKKDKRKQWNKEKFKIKDKHWKKEREKIEH